jgi:hypothetical protein
MLPFLARRGLLPCGVRGGLWSFLLGTVHGRGQGPGGDDLPLRTDFHVIHQALDHHYLDAAAQPHHPLGVFELAERRRVLVEPQFLRELDVQVKGGGRVPLNCQTGGPFHGPPGAIDQRAHGRCRRRAGDTDEQHHDRQYAPQPSHPFPFSSCLQRSQGRLNGVSGFF